MPFLAGSLAFERYSVDGFEETLFGEEQLEQFSNYVAGRNQSDSPENIHIGFLGGQHLFDQEFDLGKNVINEAVHAGLRIETNEIPSAIKKAWLQIELNGLAKDSPSGVPTKAMRKEAQEAVEERCLSEAATGKYRKFKSHSFLWDLRQSMLYFGGSGNAGAHCADLMEKAFGLELRRVSAGSLAHAWAQDADRASEMDDVTPACFVPDVHRGTVHWTNEHSTAPDFLGNEFLLWLWWKLETDTDTFMLADESEVIVMLNKTLSLECPCGETGKETFSAECPIQMPEAIHAIQLGKMPRKTSMSVVRDGQRFDLTLQAESFAISGAKIHLEEGQEVDDEGRIDLIRTMADTVDQMFFMFCDVRTSEAWSTDLTSMQDWLKRGRNGKQKAAA